MSAARTLAAGAAALLLLAGGPQYAPAQTEPADQVEVPVPDREAAETEVVAGATLYQRLGGYEAIAETVDDFLQRMGQDQRLQRFLVGLSDATMRRLRQRTVDFLCESTGGPCFYTGLDMAEAHHDTGITAADWDRAAELMGETLDARGILGELREEIGGFIAGLRDDIVAQE
jgi:hemoglobin